jgi:hypothetical protein
MSGSQKWRSFLKSAAIGTGSLFIFAFGLFAREGRTLASTMLGDVFFAAAFSIFYCVIAFPILVFVGFLLRLVLERLLKRQLPRRRYAPWLIPAVLGVGCLASSFLFDRSPRTLFRYYVNLDPPASMFGFQCWWITLPGDSLYILRFDMDPSEFNKLLVNHSFVQESNPEEIREALAQDFPTGLVGSNIQLPAAPLSVVYRYSRRDNLQELPHIVDVFATADRHQVVICGDN